MRRWLAGVAVVALLLAADPLESRLRADAPAAPEANRIGAGRLLGGVLGGSFRPLLLNYLWIRADTLYGQRRFDELHQLYATMRSLYPRNERAREYLGWNLAFNLKNEALTPELAWSWARAGLEILSEIDGGGQPLADWALKQCGQNPLALLRYAGPAWEAEKRERLALRAWTRERYGAPLGRFELGLHALRGHDHFFDRLRLCNLLIAQVYDDWMARGESERVDEALAAIAFIEKKFADEPLLQQQYAYEATLLRDLRGGKLTPPLLASQLYTAAAALWGLGAHRRDLRFLHAAQAAFRRVAESYEREEFAEERALVAAWIRHVERGGPRPSLPFDEGP